MLPPNERGDVAAFSFPVRRPKTREDVNEEDCPICLGTKPNPKSWIIFGACNHATCNSCFKKLVADQKMLASCPICRTILGQRNGERGGPTPKPSMDQPVSAPELTTATTPAAAVANATAAAAAAPIPSDNNV